MSFAAAAALQGVSQIGSAMLSQYYNKKNMRDQAALQYRYAQRYALNSPSWNVEGLRDAGLNPILAVSNGVNLGANIPNITNSSPKADIDIPAVEALKASKEMDVASENASANTSNAKSNSISSEADMLRAKSDAALKQAEAAKVIQDTKFDKEGGGFKNPVVNDLVRAASKGFDSVEAFQKSLTRPQPFGDVPKSNSYIDNTPKIEHSWRDSMHPKDSSNFSVLEKEYGSDVARELYIPAQKARSSWKSNPRSKRALFVR